MDIQTLLINLQKHIVHSKKDAQENPWEISDLLANIVVYIFPFYDDVCQDKKQKCYVKFESLLSAVDPFLYGYKERLSKFNRNALYKAVREEWCKTLENPFALITPISLLFESIDSDNRVHLKPNTFIGLLKSDFFDSSGKYGTMDYFPPDPNTPIKKPRQKKKKNMAIPCDNETYSQAIKEIKECFEQLGFTRKNNPSCYRYDIFSKRESTDWKSPQYAWQWNFSIDEYNGIKQLLLKHASVLKEVIKQSKICCKLLQLYVSEWYKRDFNGKDKRGNAYSSLGIDNISEEICKQLFGKDEDKYKKIVYHDNADGTGDGRYIDTIYVDGGLPLRYLLSEERGDEFTRSIRKIIEGDSGNIDIACDLGDLCKNEVVNQSYQGRILFPDEDEASIFDFIQETIINETLVVDGFEDFKDKIHAMKKESLKCKFKINYKLFKAGCFFQLTPKLCLNPEPNGVKYAISSKRLEQWSITPIGNSFEIRIQCGDQLIWERRFSKCLGDYYVTSDRQESYDLRIDSTLLTKPWIITVDDNEVKTALDNPLQKQGFVQLYSKDVNNWNSISGNNYDCVSILFDRTKDCSIGEDESSSLVNNYLGWTKFKEKIEFCINGKKQVCYSNAGVLVVELKNKHYHHLSQYFEGVDTEGQSLELIRLGDKPSFSVVITERINGDITSREIQEKDYIIECRKGITGSFTTLLEDSINESGYWDIRISYLRRNRIVRCFALPSDAQIDNNSRHQRTDFFNFGDLTIQYNNEQLNPVRKNVVRKQWNLNEIKYNSPIAFYTITDGVASFRLNTYQPIKATVAKKTTNNDLFGVGRDRDCLKIPILLLDKLDLFRLPENEIISIDKYRRLEYAFSQMRICRYEAPYNHQIQNVTIKTFTHYQPTHQQNTIVLELGNIKHDSLCFSFIPSNNPLSMQDMKLERENDTRYFFDLSNINQEGGVIVQKIDKYDFPNVLTSPIHTCDLNPEQRKTELEKFHSLYVNGDFSKAIAYFNVAIKTGMYFACFEPLLGLVWSDHDSAKLLARFYQTYCDQNESVNYKALWRFADEFLFDWTLIPRNIWNELFSDNLDSVNQLFSRRDGRDVFLSKYWEFAIKSNRELGKQNSCYNIYLRTISETYNKQYDNQNANFWIQKTRKRVPVLREIQNSTFFENINKYIK